MRPPRPPDPGGCCGPAGRAPPAPVARLAARPAAIHPLSCPPPAVAPRPLRRRRAAWRAAAPPGIGGPGGASYRHRAEHPLLHEAAEALLVAAGRDVGGQVLRVV